MILNIREDIRKEATDRLITSLNELEKGDKLFIYLNSEGGDPEDATAIINIVNNNADRIELVGYGTLYSAAFDIFFMSICHRMLLPSTLGMCHHCKTKIEINENGTPYAKLDQANRLWTKNQKEHTIAFCKSLNMTEKEVSEVRQGKDVYFQPKRMQELLKVSQQNINNT